MPARSSSEDRPIPKNARILPEKRAESEPIKIEPPEAPDWLPIGAAEVWTETAILMIASRTWRPACAPTLAMFAVLSDEFRSNAGQLPVTKLTVLRLLQNDLGLSPNYGRYGFARERAFERVSQGIRYESKAAVQ